MSGLAGAHSGSSGGGRFIVGAKTKRGVRAARRRADAVGRELDFGDIGHAVAGRFSERAVEALRTHRDVRYVEADGRVEALAETLPWGVDRIDADAAHADGQTGEGAHVAVLDTGIDSDHPDLQGNLGEGYAVETCSGTDCTHNWDDDHDHGTHCAGVTAAVDNAAGVVGVGTDVTVHAVKVLAADNYGTWSGVAEGITWVADRGYDVISMSLGSSGYSSSVRDACRYAADRDVLIVAAAGNEGPCSDCVWYPAAFPEVVAVSSIDGDDSLSSFSSTGPEIELAAPGGAVYSTVVDGYATWSGTSMATPHVSGVGALLRANGHSATQARERLQSTAEDLGLPGDEQGYGLVDAAAAVDGTSGDTGDTDDTEDTGVVVSTGSAVDVGETAATLRGSLGDLGGAASADASFEWGEAGGSLPNASSAGTLSSTGSFSADLGGLAAGTEYEFRAVADASDGDADTGATVAFATDGASTGDAVPVIDGYSVSEAGSPNPHAEITADWSVSDLDGDLDAVLVEVIDASGRAADSTRASVGGASASGSEFFKLKHAGGPTYDVRLTVTDVSGRAVTRTDTVTS